MLLPLSSDPRFTPGTNDGASIFLLLEFGLRYESDRMFWYLIVRPLWLEEDRGGHAASITLRPPIID